MTLWAPVPDLALLAATPQDRAAGGRRAALSDPSDARASKAGRLRKISHQCRRPSRDSLGPGAGRRRRSGGLLTPSFLLVVSQMEADGAPCPVLLGAGQATDGAI